MTQYLAWLVPAGLAIGLAIYALRSRKTKASEGEASSRRLVGLLILTLASLFLILWLILDALSETDLHSFTLPAIVSFILLAGFAINRILRA